MAAKKRCVIISAAPDQDLCFIRSSIKNTDYIVCADGGCETINQLGIIPDLIVGDFDSFTNTDVFSKTEKIVLDTHKDDTDTMHCIEEGLKRGYNNFLLLGATGGRTDHLLANLSILIFLKNHNAKGIISDKYNDIILLDIGDNKFNVDKNTTISVIPYGSDYAELSYKGLYYTMSHGKVSIDYPYTISNESIDNNVTITLHSGMALVFIIHTDLS